MNMKLYTISTYTLGLLRTVDIIRHTLVQLSSMNKNAFSKNAILGICNKNIQLQNHNTFDS